MNALLKYTLCILFLLLGQQSVHANIGSVATITGAPGEIARGKQKIPGTVGASVESDDIVTTKAGVANITFKDDTKVKVSENSRLLIDDFVFDPKKSDAGKLAMKVGLGAVRYASGQIAKSNPQQVAVKTPTATVSVRGTDFALIVDEAGRSLIVLLPSCRPDQRPKQYELDENRCAVGKIAVSTLAGEVVMDRAFQATYIASSTSKPSKPVILNITESAVSGDIIVSMPVEIAQTTLLANRGKTTARGGNNRDSGENSSTEEKEASTDTATQSVSQSVSQGDSNNSASTASVATADATAAFSVASTNTVASIAAINRALPSVSGNAQSAGANRSSANSTADELSTINATNNSIRVAGGSNNTSTVSGTTVDDPGDTQSASSAILTTVLSSDDMYDDALSSIANQYLALLRRNAALQQQATGTATTIEAALAEGITVNTVIVTPQQLLQLLSSLGTTILGGDSLLSAGMTGYTSSTGSTALGTGSMLNTVNTINGSTGSTSLGANTVTTLPGASYTQSSPNSTTIIVDNVSQLIATCDTITRICLTIDGQQQYTSTDGVLNNGSSPPSYGTSLVLSRLAETYEHYSQVRAPAANSNNIITLIQNDIAITLAIGNMIGANIVTINQRWGNR